MKKIVVNVKTGRQSIKNMTKAERAEVKKRALSVEKEKTKRRWHENMHALDQVLPRYAEDIMQVVGVDKFPKIMRDRLAEKSALRAANPNIDITDTQKTIT